MAHELLRLWGLGRKWGGGGGDMGDCVVTGQGFQSGMEVGHRTRVSHGKLQLRLIGFSDVMTGFCDVILGFGTINTTSLTITVWRTYILLDRSKDLLHATMHVNMVLRLHFTLQTFLILCHYSVYDNASRYAASCLMCILLDN